MNRYQSQSSCSSKKPLKRCKRKEKADVVLIDIDDDDDFIVVDSPQSYHQKQGGSSEQTENHRVSPQSVISIEDDDESYTNHLHVHDEVGFADFKSDATSSQGSGRAYGILRHTGSGCNGKHRYSRNSSSRKCYTFGDRKFEFEPVEVDSDCEVMEDSSGMLREQWEKAASQKKVNGQKSNFDAEGSRSASVCNINTVRQKDMTDFFCEVSSCSKAHVPFTGMKKPSAYNIVDEEPHIQPNHDTLFPEFDWMNLGGRSSSQKPNSADKIDVCLEKSRKISKGISSSQKNVCGASLGLDDQRDSNTMETEGTSRGECSSGTKPGHEMNINQADSSKGHEMNTSCSHADSYFENRNLDQKFHTAHFDCACIFPSDCECRRSRDLGVEKVDMEEQLRNPIRCKEKSNNSVTGFDNKSGDALNGSHAGADCEANCIEECSQEKDGELEKVYHSETVVRQDSYSESKGPAVETDTNCVPEGGSNDTPAAREDVQSLKTDIINVKERLKETEEYKRAMEQELASRQQQIKLQAEEAQKLRKRKKAETLRLSNLECRQKQRLEEVRASQKQDGANLNLKEQLRSEIMKELKALELRFFDMASLLRSLGVQVEGGLHPSPQQVHGAYKRAVLKFHPDRTSRSNLKQQVEAEEKFKLISRMKEKYKFP